MKTLSALFFLLLAATATAAPPPPAVQRYEEVLLRRPEAGTAFDRILEHYRGGPGTEALADRWAAAFEEAGDPATRARWAVLSALLAESRGMTESAGEWYETAVESDDAPVSARTGWAALLARTGRFEQAAAVLEAALEGDRTAGAERAEILRQLALTRERDFQTARAIDAWKALAGMDPDDPFLLEEAADGLARNRDYEGAKEIFARLAGEADADPYQRVRHRIRVARLTEAAGDHEAALDLYQEALPEAASTSWLQKELRTRIEELYRRQENLPGLAEHYEKRLADEPDSGNALLLAGVLDDLGRTAEATGWIRKAAEWSPGRTDLSLRLAERLLADGDAAGAVAVLRPLARSHPDEVVFAERLGEALWAAYEETGDEDDRRAALDEWNRIAPGREAEAGAVLRLAEVLRRHDLAEEALAAYRRAAEADPESVDIRERWADWLFVLGRPSEGFAVLSEIVADGRGSPARHLRLAQLRKRYEDPEGALESIRAGLAGDTPDEAFDLLSLQWNILAAEQRWEEAAALYEDLRAAAPNDFFRETVDLRQVSALAAAGRIDEKAQALAARLTGGAIGADDLRLLLLIALETRDAETAEAAAETALARHPESAPLARAALRYYEEYDKSDEALAVLETLLAIEPKRKGEWLEAMARIRLGSGDFDEAVATARERMRLNPADPDGLLFLADTQLEAGRFDEAVATMEEGAALAEDPGPIRTRLVEILGNLGRPDEANRHARALFEEAGTLEERLRALPPLVDLSIQLGTLDRLIEEFERKRLADAEGHRYALFLATIHRRAGDSAAARRNLIDALAARPEDTALIREIIDLAREQRATEDWVRHSARLAELEPSDENHIRHLEVLLEADRREEARAWMERHHEALLADTEILRRIARRYPDAAGPAIELLGRNLAKRGGDADAQFAYGELLAAIGEFAAAEESFWRVYRSREAAAAPAATPAPKQPRQSPWGLPVSSDFMSRVQKAFPIRQIAEQTVLETGAAAQRRHFHSPPQAAVPSAVERRDAALIYLAALALRDDRADEFIATVEADLEKRVDPAREALFTWFLLAEDERLLDHINRLLDDEDADEDILALCGTVAALRGWSSQTAGDAQYLDETLALFDRISERLETIAPDEPDPFLQIRVHLLAQAGRPDEAAAIADRFLDTQPVESEADLTTALQMITASGRFQILPGLLAEWYEKPRSGSASLSQRLAYAPFLPIHAARSAPEESRPTPAETARIVAESLRIRWEKEPAPRAKAASGPIRWQTAPTDFPGENPWMAPQEKNHFSALHGLLGPSEEAAALFEAEMEAMAGELEGERAIPPRIARALWMSLKGDSDEAVRQMIALAEEHPDRTSLRIVTARALFAAGRHEETLQWLPAPADGRLAGPNRKSVEILRLHTLIALERKDEAEERIRELLRHDPSLTSDHRMNNLLHQSGMWQAVRNARASSPAAASPASALRSNDWNQINAVLNRMQTLKNEGKTEEANAIARLILSHDPLTSPRNNERHLRDSALGVLENEERAALEKETLAQLESSPDSALLHYRMFEMILHRSNRPDETDPDLRTHLRRLLDLRPDDHRLRNELAALLSSKGRHEDARDVYVRLLAEAPDAAVSTNAHSLVRAYDQADSLDDLVAVLEDPAFAEKVSRMQPGSLNNFISNLAQLLENRKRFGTAARVRTTALPLVDRHQRLPLLDDILESLVRAGKQQEARDIFWKTVFEEEEDAGKTRANRFGFGQTGAGHGPNLFSGVHYSNGFARVGGLDVFASAFSLGLGGRMRTELAENRPPSMSEQDARILGILLRAWDRDPTLPEEILEEETLFQSPNVTINLAILAQLATEMESWEEGREAAFHLHERLHRQMSGGSFLQHSHMAAQQLNSALSLSRLADGREQREKARAALRRNLPAIRQSLAPGQANLPDGLLAAYLGALIRTGGFDSGETAEWIERVRERDRMRNNPHPVAGYLESLAGPAEPEAYRITLDDEGNAIVLSLAGAPPDPSRGGPLPLVPVTAENTGEPADPVTVFVTPDPREAPVAVALSEATGGRLRELLPGGIGHALAARDGADPAEAEAGRWSVVIAGKNLLPQPNPAAPSGSGREPTVQPAGWAELPAAGFHLVHFPEGHPVRSGVRRMSIGDPHQRDRFVSEPIAVSGENDLVLEGWFTGLDNNYNQGDIFLGLVFLDADGDELTERRYGNPTTFPDTWVRGLHAFKARPETGRTLPGSPYPIHEGTAAVQVMVEVDPGVAFGGLRLVELPAPSGEAVAAVDVPEIVKEARAAAAAGDGGAAVALFLRAARANPGDAFRRWPSRNKEWTHALRAAPNLDELFAFAARPEVHVRDSFRYGNRSINNSFQLLELGALAVESGDSEAAADFLRTLFEHSVLSEREKRLLLLDAITAGIEPATEEETLDLALAILLPGETGGSSAKPPPDAKTTRRVLLLPRENKESPADSFDSFDSFRTYAGFTRFAATLDNVRKLGLSEALLGRVPQVAEPDDARAVSSTLLRSWVLAPSDPEAAASEFITAFAWLEGRDDPKPHRTVPKQFLARLIDSGASPAAVRRSLHAAAATVFDGGEAARATFRFRLLKELVQEAGEPDPALERLFKEERLRGILLNPSGDRGALASALKTAVATQDYETAGRIIDAARGDSSLNYLINDFLPLIPRLADPGGSDPWPVALAGRADASGPWTVAIRFVPDGRTDAPREFDGAVRLPAKPLLPTLPGLEKTVLRFGVFPTDLTDVAEFPGDTADRVAAVELPAANGFLRAVAFIGGREVPGPLTTVVGGAPHPVEELAEAASPEPFGAPQADDPEIPVEDRLRFTLESPDLAEGDDLVFTSWLGAVDNKVPTVWISPEHADRDRFAFHRFYGSPGTFLLAAIVIPERGGSEILGPLESIRFYAGDGSRIIRARFTAIPRADWPYLEWLEDVRDAAAAINRGEPPDPPKLRSLAARDPYGSAVALLPTLIDAFLEEGDAEAAAAYLRSVDEREATPFHKSYTHRYHLRSHFADLAADAEAPPAVRWEAALAYERLPISETDLAIGKLFEAAGDDPARVAIARERLDAFLSGRERDPVLAESAIRDLFLRQQTWKGSPRYRMTALLRHDYHRARHESLVERLAETGLDMDRHPSRIFALESLLFEDEEEAIDSFGAMLGSDDHESAKSFHGIVGLRNLRERGVLSPETHEDLLFALFEHCAEEPPPSLSHGRFLGMIRAAGEIPRACPEVSGDRLATVAETLAASIRETDGRPSNVFSSNMASVLDRLDAAGAKEARNDLIRALRGRSGNSRQQRNFLDAHPIRE
ncbi:MAG: tetratricopeptide repeat protein [Puniceicoccaceae bacterium]